MNSAFVVKSARINALTLVLKTADERLLTTQLRAFFTRAEDMNVMPFVLDQGNLKGPIPFAAIADCCRDLKVRLLGVNENDDTDRRAILDAGLNPLSATAAKVPETPAQESRRPTLLIDKPVRSGERVYAEKTDLICTALVSHGAEIIADGHIHVYAPLRGRAMAGESGDKNARIFVQSMQAQLVAVAGVYRIFDRQLPDSLHRHAVCVSLQGDKLGIRALNFN